MLTQASPALRMKAPIRKRLMAPTLLLLLTIATYSPFANAQAPSAASPSPEVITTLEPGSALERELAPGKKHGYQLVLPKGQFARVVVEQRGIDVAVRVSTTDGKLIAKADSELGNQGREKVEFVAESDGPIQIKVEISSGAAGRYVIQIDELRTATAKDVVAQQARNLELDVNRFFSAGKPDESLAAAEKSLAFHEQAFGPNGLETATALHTLAFVVYEIMRDYAKAETLHRRALAIRQKLLEANDPLIVDSLIQLSDLYRAKGDFAAALTLRERALEIEEPIVGANNVALTNSLRSIAILYNRKGDDARAAALQDRVLTIRESVLGPDHEDVAFALREISTAYSDRGDYDKAEAFQRRALAIFEKAKNPNLVSAALNSLGVIYARKGDEATAEQLFLRSLKVEEDSQGPETSTAAFYRLNLGNFYRQNKNYTKGEEYLQRALEIWEKRFGPEYRNLPLVLLSQAQLNIEMSNLDKAQAQLERALALRTKTLGEGHRDVITVLNKLAWVHALKGEVAEAVSFGVRANNSRAYDIDVNLADTSERQKLAFLGSIPEQLNQALSLHIRYAPTDPAAAQAAVTAILQRKGLVQERVADTLSAMRGRLSSADRDLFDKWNAATSRLARVVLNGPQRVSLAEHEKRIKAMAEEREKLEEQIVRGSSGFFPRAENVTLAVIQAAIPARAALVEFAVYRPFDPRGSTREVAYGEARYAAYVLRRQGEVGWRDIGAAKEIDAAVSALRGALRDPKRNDVMGLARAVDAKVMRPLRPLLGDATQLLLSPDGQLNLIPFESLIDDQGRYLIESQLISYLTSGRDLLRMAVRRESKKPPVVIANPFFGVSPSDLLATAGRQSRPVSRKRNTVTTGRDLREVYFASLSGTAQEARTIKKIFGADVLTGADATESAVKSLVAPRVLHIATHGFFLEDENATAETREPRSPGSVTGKIENPLLRSGLALANANSRQSGKDDGILTALEASGLNLWGTKLVVLSACDTGVGEVRNGEGVYGLRRAFVLAGAESLVMSLWPVSDYTTRELMTNYYKNLKQGMGRAESLRAVQLEMVGRNRKLHPFYWANFIQSGEWADLEGKR